MPMRAALQKTAAAAAALSLATGAIDGDPKRFCAGLGEK